MIVSAIVAVWVRAPDVPLSVIVVVPAAVEDPAVSVRVWAAPGVRVKVDGLAVTPAGSPLRETLTLPVNPLSAVAVTETVCPAAPTVRLRVDGEAARLKSALLGGFEARLLDVLTPQPASNETPAPSSAPSKTGFMRMAGLTESREF